MVNKLRRKISEWMHLSSGARRRRPEGHNIAFKYPAGIDSFKASNIATGIDRPGITAQCMGG